MDQVQMVVYSCIRVHSCQYNNSKHHSNVPGAVNFIVEFKYLSVLETLLETRLYTDMWMTSLPLPFLMTIGHKKVSVLADVYSLLNYMDQALIHIVVEQRQTRLRCYHTIKLISVERFLQPSIHLILKSLIRVRCLWLYNSSNFQYPNALHNMMKIFKFVLNVFVVQSLPRLYGHNEIHFYH